MLVILGWNNKTNSQSQWTQTTTPPGGSIWAMETIGASLFAGTVSDGVYFSSDDGTTWVQRNGAFPNMQIMSMVVNGSDIFVGTDNGHIYKTSDNGLNWTDVSPSGISPSSNIRLAHNGITIFAGTAGDGVFASPLSTLSTTSWTSFNTGLTVSSNLLDTVSLKIKGTTIYAGTYAEGVWSSPTNSPNWSLTSSTMPTSSDYISALDLGGSTIYAGNTSGLPVLYRSINNGVNWIQSNTSVFANKPVYVVFNDGNTVFAGTEGQGILVSSDNGITWSSFNQGFQDSSGNWFCNQINVRSLAFTSTKMFAGTDCGVWKRDIITLGENDFVDKNQFVLYPNPNNGKFKINYNTTNRTDIEIFNILGEKILTKTNSIQTTNEIDISNVQKGIYFVKIGDGNSVHTKKIIVR